MKIVLNNKVIGLILLFSVVVISLMSLFITENRSSDLFSLIVKIALFFVSICIALSLGQIKNAHILVKIFFFCTLIPVCYFDGSSDLMLNDRLRWLFYSSVILLVDIHNIRIWIRVLLLLMLINIVAPILFSSYYFPNEGYNSGWEFEIEKFPSVLFFCGIFLFGIQNQLSFKNKLIVYISYVLTLLFYVYYGRRTGSLLILLYLISPIFISRKVANKIKHTLLSVIVVFLLTYIVVENVGTNIFDRLIERMDADSRSGVDLLAITALSQYDNWWFGLGVQGGYPNPIEIELSDMRYSVETGVLDVIMDGGIFLWVSMMILSIYAFYLGCFKSNNSFIRCLSFVVLVYILMQYPLPQVGVDTRGYMVFTAIGFCLNKEYREYSDVEMFEKIM